MHGKVLVPVTRRTATANVSYMGKMVEYDYDTEKFVGMYAWIGLGTRNTRFVWHGCMERFWYKQQAGRQQ